jgi:hypothetical protein
MRVILRYKGEAAYVVGVPALSSLSKVEVLGPVSIMSAVGTVL